MKKELIKVMAGLILIGTTACSQFSLFDDIINGRDILLSIKMTPKQATFALVPGQRLTVKGNYENGRTRDLSGQVTWSATDPSVGYVISGGDFQAVGIGDTVITARIDDFKAVAAITVRKNAGTIYVDSGYTAGFNDGTPEFPYESVAQGVSAATAKGAAEVLVAKGIYSEDTINIETELTIFGGYNRSQDETEDWKTDVQLGQAETVDFTDTVINLTSDTGFLFQDGITNAGMQGFTVRGDVQNENVFSIAVSIQSASVTIENNRIVGGLASSSSTAIAINSGAPVIINNEISGGESGTVSRGISITNADPVVTGNSIYAGSSDGTNVGIVNQNASPTIQDNPIISSDNEAGDAAPSVHFAVLNQSLSNPVIKGNGDDSDPSQFITGPATGSSNSYRIKCENSSDGQIDGNTIEVDATAGILAISSSPVISNNDMTSTGNTIPAIRGENTSFRVEDNTIDGSITVTSSSKGPVLQRNFITGDISVEGGSTDVRILDHSIANEDTGHHHPRTNGVLQIDSILLDEDANVVIENNTFRNLVASGDASGSLTANYILNDTSAPIQLDGADINIERNFIEARYAQTGTTGVRGISLANITETFTIQNNTIHVENTDTVGADRSHAFAIIQEEITGLVTTINNLVIAKTNNTSVGVARGSSINNFDDGRERYFNNIFHIQAANVGNGYNATDADDRPAAMAANYFLLTGAVNTFEENGTHTASDYNTEDMDGATVGIYQYNEDISVDPRWALINTYGGLYTDLEDCRTSNGGSVFECDFHIADVNSDFVQTAQASMDVNSTTATDNANVDFDGNCRDSGTSSAFAIGPYEYSADIITCP